MSKYELTKTVEARKLHKRTGVPTPEPPVTIPFGAIIEDLVEDRDVGKFNYLGEPYQCLYEILSTAVAPIQTAEKAPPSEAVPQAEPRETVGAGGTLQWEQLRSTYRAVMRAKVPGGWLVLVNGQNGGALTFYPDEKHRWDGSSLR